MTVRRKSPLVIVDTKELVLRDKKGKPILNYLGEEQLDEKAWLQEREQGRDLVNLSIEVLYQFGGSSASIITGTNPWNNKLLYWQEKKGLKKKKHLDTDATRSGHIYEPQLRAKFGDIMTRNGHKVKIVNDTNMYRCAHTDDNGDLLYPFMIADVDGIISVNGKVGILECKTLNVETPHGRNIRDNYWKEGKVPPYYEDQVRHYMCVMNLDFAYVICGWGPLDSQTAIIKVTRDMDKEEALCKLESDFYQSLIDDVEPDERDVPVEQLLTLYGQEFPPVADTKGDAIEISDEFDLDIRQLLSIKEQEEKIDAEIERLTEQKEKLSKLGAASELQLTKLLGDNSKAYGMYEIDDKHIVWVHCNRSKKRATYDCKSIKNDFPELWEKAGSESFSISKLTTAEKSLIAHLKNPDVYSDKTTFSINVSDKK